MPDAGSRSGSAPLRMETTVAASAAAAAAAGSLEAGSRTGLASISFSDV